jgi:hypothetical protein
MSGTRDERPMSRVGMNEMREMRPARVKGPAKGGKPHDASALEPTCTSADAIRSVA